MDNASKIDELVLALMSLNKFDDGNTIRAWKSFDESLERLHAQNYIRSSAPNAKSVLLTPEGLAYAQQCVKKHITENA